MSSTQQQPNRIGPHISLTGTTIPQALKSLPKGCDCFQCFLGAPIQYTVKKVSDEEAAQAQQMLHLNDMRMYVHAPYIINLANSDKAAPGRACLQTLLDTNARISSTHTGTILHIGANGTIQQVADQLNSMDIRSPLLLENCAGEGSKLGATMEELQKLMELTDSHNVGLCIDTCHAHSAGLADMRETTDVVKLFDDLDAYASGRPTLFHLNDSKVPFKAKVDRHLPVGKGTIWSETKDSLTRFAELARETARDIILETPSDTLAEMAWLKTLG